MSISLGNGVTRIGDNAFYGCSSLTSVTIPDSVTSIGVQAFRRCQVLPSMRIPDTITSIPERMFSQCFNLTNITIPDSVTSIGFRAFSDCYALANVTIGSGVTSIGVNVFYGCSFTSIAFPENLTSIGTYAFENCSNCEIFDFRRARAVPCLLAANAFYLTSTTKEIIVPDNLYDDWIVANNWSSDDNNIRPCIVKASQSSLGVLETLTYVTYTEESGLGYWSGEIKGEIAGSSSSPYYTTQIPNI